MLSLILFVLFGSCFIVGQTLLIYMLENGGAIEKNKHTIMILSAITPILAGAASGTAVAYLTSITG